MPVLPPARATFSKGSPLWISFARIVSLPFIHLILQSKKHSLEEAPSPTAYPAPPLLKTLHKSSCAIWMLVVV